MGKKAIPRPAELEYTPANCHAREILARVGDKWSVYVIHVLGDAGTLRFNELRSRVDGISQRMLTVTLRGMERDGLVTRTVYPEVPPRVEYALTSLGATLRQLVRGLVGWSGAHLSEVDAARAAYDARNRRPAKSARLEHPAPPRQAHPSRAAQLGR
ncbi:MAG: helix-turn-helix transcriptional regulator [Gemmatimonadota bacterium]|nr:helix-turn-helix transcriptional regulator [Gemmatimonadota bacterium]